MTQFPTVHGKNLLRQENGFWRVMWRSSGAFTEEKGAELETAVARLHLLLAHGVTKTRAVGFARAEVCLVKTPLHSDHPGFSTATCRIHN